MCLQIVGSDPAIRVISRNPLGFSVIPSAGNFVSFESGLASRRIYEALLQRGVIVRPLGNYGMNEHLRVTVGLPDENERFLEALSQII